MTFLTMDQEQDSVSDPHECSEVRKLFLSALLLSGSAAGAEQSILEAICTISSGEVPGDALLCATWRAAAAPQAAGQRETSDTPDPYTSSLPVELRRVLLLPENPRRCFVLHLLIGLPLSECSHLLSLNDCEVEQNTISAALALAALEDQAAIRCGPSFERHTRIGVVSTY